MTAVGFLLLLAMCLWATGIILAKYLVLSSAQILFHGSYAIAIGGTISNIYVDRSV